MTTDCVFCRIVAGELPATVVLETDSTLAFRDINPAASTHVIVLAKAHYANLAQLSDADPELAAAVLATAVAVARAEGVDDAYRLLFNSGAPAGQTIFHVHAHVLSGSPPVGLGARG